MGIYSDEHDSNKQYALTEVKPDEYMHLKSLEDEILKQRFESDKAGADVKRSYGANPERKPFLMYHPTRKIAGFFSGKPKKTLALCYNNTSYLPERGFLDRVQAEFEEVLETYRVKKEGWVEELAVPEEQGEQK